MNWLVSAGLVVAAVIHLLPVPGILGPDWLARLYGVAIADPDMTIMMRHRALLFGVLGLFMLAAAAKPEWQAPAAVAGLVSAAGFILLAWQVGGYSPAIARVVTADIVAVAALLISGVGLVLS